MRARGHRQSPCAALALVTAAGLTACLEAPESASTGDEPVQLLANPSFEDGLSGWDHDGTIEVASHDDLSLPPSDSGPRVALLGRADDDWDSIEQLVMVPPWTASLEVSGVRCFSTSEPFDTTSDELWIYLESIDGTDVEDLMEASNLDASTEGCAWSSFRFAAADHAGQQIWFVVEAVMNTGSPTSFAIDGLSLTASP